VTEEKKRGGWKPGQSGNPRGKPPGSGELQKLRASITAHVPAILTKLVEAAQAGDVQAARLILERVLPPVKAMEHIHPIKLPKNGTLTDQGRAVLAAAAAGELPLSQSAQLLTALSALGRVAEVDELAARIAALEKQHGKT